MNTEILRRPEVRFALGAVGRAARLVRAVQAEMISPAILKDDRSPVTVADFAAQAVVARLLDEALPGVPLVAEESTAALGRPEEEATLDQVTKFVGRVVEGATPETVCEWIDRGTAETADRFWTLDPVDGTQGFLRGDQYAVALALVEAGQVEIGVLGCPELVDGHVPQVGGPGSLVLAVRGQGTWTVSLDAVSFDTTSFDTTSFERADAFTRLHVSRRDDPTQARLLRSVEGSHTNTGKIGELIESLGIEAAPVALDSQAKYAVLAAGGGDLLVRLLSSKRPDYREMIWDQAAGSLVVEEAGGQISDLAGRPLDFSRGRTLADNRGVLATNGHLHPQALGALAQISA